MKTNNFSRLDPLGARAAKLVAFRQSEGRESPERSCAEGGKEISVKRPA